MRDSQRLLTDWRRSLSLCPRCGGDLRGVRYPGERERVLVCAQCGHETSRQQLVQVGIDNAALRCYEEFINRNSFNSVAGALGIPTQHVKRLLHRHLSIKGSKAPDAPFRARQIEKGREAYELLQSEGSALLVAKTLGVHISTVRQRLKLYGVADLPKPRRPVSPLTNLVSARTKPIEPKKRPVDDEKVNAGYYVRYMRGESAFSISVTEDISVATVYTRIGRHTKNNPGLIAPGERYAAIREDMYRQRMSGRTVKEIAAEYGVTATSVYERIYRYLKDNPKAPRPEDDRSRRRRERERIMPKQHKHTWKSPERHEEYRTGEAVRETCSCGYVRITGSRMTLLRSPDYRRRGYGASGSSMSPEGEQSRWNAPTDTARWKVFFESAAIS